MAEFWQSELVDILGGNEMLSQEAWDFATACMDDFCVDESEEDGVTMYELRGTLMGWRNGKEVRVTQVYYSDLGGIAAVIEHLALTNRLLIEHIDREIEKQEK